MIAAILAFAFITAIASALHGGDYLSKGKTMAAHAMLSLTVSPVTVLSVAIFWGLFRRSKQAIAELDYYSGKGGLEAIEAAYPKPLGKLMAMLMKWVEHETLPIFNAIPKRRKQELVGGFVLGIITGAPLIVIMEVLL